MVVVSRGEMEGQRFRIDFSIVMRCWFFRKKRTIVTMKVLYYYFPPVALFTTKSVPQKKKNKSCKIEVFLPSIHTEYISSLGIRAQKNLFSYHANALNIRTNESKHHDCHFTSLPPQFQYFMSYFSTTLRITSTDSEVHDCHFRLHSFHLVQRRTVDP